MKEITKEQIDKAIEEVSAVIAENTNKAFYDATGYINKEQENNPLAYDIVAITVAQNNAMTAMKEVLYKLFTN